MSFRFKPAARDEPIVFGAERPGYPTSVVDEGMVQDWILFMKDEGIKRVCCLLSQSQLDYYGEDLLAIYRQDFGNVPKVSGELRKRTWSCLLAV